MRHDHATPSAGPATAEELLRRYRRTGDRALRNQAVEDHRWLAVVIARQYATGREPLDDLVQVALVALLKAAERFDPDYGVEFRTFAAVTARGELRRYFRDSTWSIRVPRRLQELRYDVRAATEVLQERLARSPSTDEIAEYLHVTADEVVDCRCADQSFRSQALDADDDAPATADRRGRNEAAVAAIDSADAFRRLIAPLPERLRRIVEMRFVDEMRQSEIAEVIGVSQVQVSRLLRIALDRLRGSDAGDASEAAVTAEIV